MPGKNIAVFGMTGCGKTTVGKAVAGLNDMTFYDVDEQIEKAENKTITEIFEKYGESYFRNAERNMIEKLAALENVVISTGGGAILDKRNVEALKKNCTIVFLDRDTEEIWKDIDIQNRPLLKDKEQLMKLYNDRIDLYKKFSDITVKNVGSVDDVAKNIVRLVKA